MERSCRLYHARKIPRKPYNKFFINQACSVKMAGYWPHSFFAPSLWAISAKKELGQYPAILTEHLVNHLYELPCIIYFKLSCAAILIVM